MNYKIFFTPTAQDMTAAITEPYKSTVLKRIEGLKENPETQGKALTRPFRGLRSIHAAGRYRVIYKVKRSEVQVIVLASGLRKAGDKNDIYELTKKLINQGFTAPYA